ncbi:unnamed protein product, partial [Staurois parvus]
CLILTSLILPFFQYLLIRHIVWSHSAHAQRFFFLWRVHVISTRPISNVQTGQGFCILQEQKEKTPPTSFNQCSAGH